MRYLIRLVLLFILLYASYLDTYAYTFEVNGINYRTTSSTECEVIYKKDYSGDIIIPSSVQFTSKLYSVTAIGDSAFYRCDKVNSVTIPNSVTNIGKYAFMNCSGLTSVTLPNSITTIGKWAFCSCQGLTSITIPNSITTIEERAFFGCKGLTTITIPNSVISIGKSAFDESNKIETIYLGENVEYIDAFAFSIYSLLIDGVDFFCYAENPPEATNAFYYAEYGIGKKLMIGLKSVLHVPEGSVEAYKSTFPWSKFRNIVAFGASPQEQIIGEWKLVSKRGFTHNFVEFKSDGTFSYTSTNDPSYEEHGEYKIEDNYLYMHFSDEPQDDWATSKILILNNMSLVLHDYEDGYSYGNPYAYSKQNPNPPSSINPLLIGKWELKSPNGPIHTHLELKEDGTFSYTSAYDDYYEEHGEYRIEGDLFYKLFSDEEKWNVSKIVDLTESSLILGNLDDDYITVYKEYKYKKVSGSSGIDSPASIPEINTIYSIEGIKNATLQKGINIIKMNDGTIKKVLIK